MIIMYILKQLPDDFVVRERSTVEVKDQGKYMYFRIKKKNRNTFDIVTELSQKLNLKEKQIGFAGSKDKKAVTEQLCSIIGVSRERVLKTKIKDAEITFVGYGDTPLSLGDLEENCFEIVVRNVDCVSVKKIDQVENYFDEQRFGGNNVQIGRDIIKKNFKQAVELMDDEKAKEHMKSHKNDYIGALQKFPLRLFHAPGFPDKSASPCRRRRLAGNTD